MYKSIQLVDTSDEAITVAAARGFNSIKYGTESFTMN